MKAKEMQNMSSEELTKKLGDLKEELFNLRFQLATGQLQNTAALRECKKEIARVKTIMRQRELNEKA